MKIPLFTVALLTCIAGHSQLTALEILHKSADSMKALTSIQYTFSAIKDQKKISGDIYINRVKPFPVFEIAQVKFTAFSLSDEGSTQVSFASDGIMFEYTNLNSGKLVRLEKPTIPAIMQTGLVEYAMLPLPCYLQAEPFAVMIRNLISAISTGDTTINKINCYTLKVITASTGYSSESAHEVYWFIGKQDFLVRGMRSKYLQQAIRILSTNRVFSSNTFTLGTDAGSLRKTDGSEPLSEGLLPIGSPAPTWTLSSNKPGTIKLEELKGKVVLLDFWGTWCVPCIRVMPEIQEIHEHFKGKQVEVIGDSVELQKSADPFAFVRKKGFTYPIVVEGSMITERYQVLTYPTVYLINQSGKIIHAEHTGGRENFKTDIIRRIEEALK